MRALLVLIVMSVTSSVFADEYDPMHLTQDAEARISDLTVIDAKRNRELPIRVYLPPQDRAAGAVPLVIFSHGLGGNREGSAFLGKHWAARGFVVVFVQHPGSDDSIWKNLPVAQRLTAMKDAASATNFQLRVQDIPAVLDQLSEWNDKPDHPLAGLLDVKTVGMSGHSFGGLTTQAIAGQAFPQGGQRWTDPRIKAAIVMSPSSPQFGDANTAFNKVKLPWLVMTGTHDGGTIGNQTPESRRRVFPALPAGDKYQLILDKAEHSVFTERTLPGEKQARNPNHHRVILALSTAFWDAYLRNDQAAKRWLNGDGTRQVMEPADLWEHK